jgi:hypothetical protein
MTAWNDFVKKIYHEGHDKDPSYQFKNALKDASRRKSEMGAAAAPASGKTKRSRGKKSRGKKSRTRRTRRK